MQEPTERPLKVFVDLISSASQLVAVLHIETYIDALIYT